MKIAIYSRKSKFTGKGESIENQIELCREYINKNIKDVTEADILVYEDEGFSGKNLDRPEFQNMMKAAKAEKFDYIVCYRLDRISRNVGDFAKLIEDLNAKETAFICINEQFDTSSPMGRAMMYIASVFAQLERETIAERIRDNMYMLSKTGRWLGGNTPIGFKSELEKRVTVDEKTHTSFKLIPVSDELKLVKFIFSKFLETQSIGGVVRYLIQNDIHTRSGKDFSNVAIKDILRNPVYCIADMAAYEYFFEKGSLLAFEKSECGTSNGLMPYNRTTHKANRQTKIEEAQWIIALGKHEGIISSMDWIKVQQLLDSKKAKSSETMRSPHTSPALLSGLLRCSDCGHFMRPHLHSNRKYEDGRTPYFYICEYKEKSSRIKCKMKNVDGYVIDKVVCDELLNYSSQSSLVSKSLSVLSDKIGRLKSDDFNNQDFLSTQLDSKKAMMKNLVFSLAQGKSVINSTDDFATGFIKEQLNELNAQCKDLEMQLAKIVITSTEYSDCNTQVEQVKSALCRFSDTFDAASLVEKRELLRSIIDRADWDGVNAHIFIVGE